jgi:hypothetical protein
MHQPAKKILEDIKTYFNGTATKEQKLELWFVLSALRGPDSDDEDVKDATANIIRYKLFGRTVIPDTTILTSRNFEGANEIRKAIPKGHFKWHAHKAFDVLGLKWE